MSDLLWKPRGAMKYLLWAAILGGAASATTLPKWLDGDVPPEPIHAKDGGVVLFEARVSARGTVSEVVELLAAEPYSGLVREALSSWRFAPATSDSSRPVTDSVLVAGVFRAPVLVDAFPPLPKAPPSERAPDNVAFPVKIVPPPFPPQALFAGIALIEVDVGPDGAVASSRVARSAGGYDGVSLDTVRYWEFRPARLDGTPVRSRAYVLFGFRPPVTHPKPNRPSRR